MLDSSRLFHLVKYVAAVVLFLFLVGPYIWEHSPQSYADILRNFQDEKKLFVAEFLDSDLGRDIVGTDLAKLCASRQWRPANKAVIVSCEPVPGGYGEVKNGHLNCIRFAIEIGAELILPRIRQRSIADISNLNGGQQSKGVPLSYFFNEAHLLRTLNRHCPQLKIYSSIDDLYDKPSLLKPLPVSIPNLAPAQSPPGTASVPLAAPLLRDPGHLRTHFATYLDTELPPERRHYPVRVHVEPSIFVWPPATDGEQVRSDLGKLLRTRDDVRALAASALWNLVRRYDLPMPDLRKGYGPPPVIDSGKPEAAKNKEVPAPPSGYIGVHLRTEKDAVDSQVFPHYDDQAEYFLSYLSALNPPPPFTGFPARVEQPPALPAKVKQRIIYLATGLPPNHQDVLRFRATAADRNVTVVMKHDLLFDAGERDMLDELTFDQRALVDREVLLRAGMVLGMVESSFAWEIALKRAVSFEDGKGHEPGEGFNPSPGMTDLASFGTVERGRIMMWKDRFSRLYGLVERAGVIYLGTWP